MIDVTEKAIAQIKEVLASEGKEDYGLRISVEGCGCSGFSYFLEIQKAPRPSDHVLKFDGVTIFIDQHSAAHLQGAILDFIEEEHVKGFIFRNQNPSPQSHSHSHSCGCGHH
ncbi:MAG: iron-sulfur cluster assembly accessory protein [Calditrichaeota bacterium]|nr:iron-sulfur cluster assembly accessory protein [Calditrichota bacterium]